MRYSILASRSASATTWSLIVTLIFALAAVVVIFTPSPAAAADGCGAGYHGAHEGGMSDSDYETRDGRAITAKAGGYVTFCDRGRTTFDQYNSRVVLGLPTKMYATGAFSGRGIRKICVSHAVTIHATNVPDGESISASLPLGFNWSKNFTDTTRTMKSSQCQASGTLIRDFFAEIAVSVPKTNIGWPKDAAITKVTTRSTATMVYASGSTTTKFAASAADSLTPDEGRDLQGVDHVAPTIVDKPVAAIASPTSRTATYSINATDVAGTVTQMRVRATPETAWRPWVQYSPTGTVVLPDRYGDFTVWFQVKDSAGNVSSERASNIITRVRDTSAPQITSASVSLGHPSWQALDYSVAASDALSPIASMRVLVSGGDWRPWVPYTPTGTVVLPDGYGTFGVTFQVMDSAGNVSAPVYAGSVLRTAPVSLALNQIDNNGVVRSCGSQANPCLDVVKRFRVAISSPRLPRTDLLFKAWRLVNGTWVETSTSPFMRMSITGSTMDFGITANLLSGLWRFQAQVPRDPDGFTEFAASDYQYLTIR